MSIIVELFGEVVGELLERHKREYSSIKDEIGDEHEEGAITVSFPSLRRETSPISFRV